MTTVQEEFLFFPLVCFKNLKKTIVLIVGVIWQFDLNYHSYPYTNKP